MIIQDLFESPQQCPECGGPAFSDMILAEKKDACYSKVRSRYKVWPSAYASGALVQCRKKGAANWGNSKNEGVTEGRDSEELADEVYAEFERIYPNLARRADERTIHAAIMDVLNYGGDSNPGALAQDVARAVKHDMQQGVAEAATDDPRFQKMMGNIQKSTPALVSGYVALNFASESPSKKIKGVTRNGKPIPDVIDNPEEFLSGKIKFTPDQVEQQLMVIGKKYGWDSIDTGQGQGYTEMFFDTNKEYTSNNQNLLAANIANTVSAINKFFNGMNSSLQATGLPGYKTDVWQGMGPPNNINQIDKLNQIVSIAKGQPAKPAAQLVPASDAGPAIGKMILKHLPSYEAENDELGYDPQAFTMAKAIANTYITQGERAGLEAQGSKIAGDLSVSDMIDELLSDAGASGLRTIWTLDEQGVAEGNYDRDDYYNARQGREYGKGLTATGYGGDGSATRRDDIFKGQSKRLPADPFARTSGAVPTAGTGRIHSTAHPDEMDEGEKVGNMDADRFDDAMARLKKLAGAGPMKTVYDPNTRRYKNMPTAVQPKQQPSK